MYSIKGTHVNQTIYIYQQHNDKIRQREKVQGEEDQFHK